MPLELAVVCNSFGMGGTAKAAVTYACHHDRARVRPRAIALTEPGVRAGELEAQGIEVVCAGDDLGRLTRQLRGVDVVHVHRFGSAEPLVPAACRAAGVEALVETNVFGRRDTSPDDAQFCAHLHISQMCAMRYRERAGIELEAFHRRQRTLYYPVDADALRAEATTRDEAHALLGLDPGRPTVVRVGRDDDRKWGDILVAMAPHLLELVPDVQIVLVGATAHRRAQLRRLGALDRVHCQASTNEPRRLAAFYCAADVFASASSIGESFGLAIAEAMALGVPIVTSSTPWTDNAQVEVVDNGMNGWVANHPRAFAEAVADLLGDERRRVAFGAAAAEKATQWHPAGLTRELERLFEAVLATGAPPPEWMPGVADQAAFEADYPRRATAQYRPLSPREQREARAAVLRERAGWVLRDLRSHPVREGRTLAGLAAARVMAAR
ncbi:MAG TPA: glycosyltransferase family 4 protein [Solirubrobacteraceae bacterium]|jgi:glycosyltransferase involved in cell wall biosynthesis|nr:glycosyltransferase family 4 protein [Solirubrobacteraceae bacterium]